MIKININITILDVIHRPVFCLNHDVSDIEFCLCLRVEPTQVGPIGKCSLCLRTAPSIRPTSVGST
jgi:hypothetical protein